MILKELKFHDYTGLKQYFKSQTYESCAYSLASILAWTNEEYQPYGVVHEDALVVGTEFQTEKNLRHMILPVAPVKQFSPAELHDIARETGFPAYWFVPESYVQQYASEEFDPYFKVRRHSELDDYIFLASDLGELKGNRYSKKRNLINQFRRDYVDPGRVAVEAITEKTVDDCLEFLDLWCEERKCDEGEDGLLSCEKQATINSLLNISLFELSGLLLRIDGQVSAFGLAAPLTEEMAVLQYEKAYSGIKGLYQYFDQQCAVRLFKGYTYINKESDMGLEGLARAKKSYYPVRKVTSYRLVLK